LLALAAVIVTAIVVTSLPGLMLRVENALCTIFGGGCGSSQQAAPPSPPLDRCLTHQVIDQQQSGIKIVVFGHEDSHSTQVQSRGDGSVNVTNSDKSGDGIDVKAGLGFSAGPVKFGVSIGGGMLWTGSDQTSFQYKDAGQAEEHQQRVQTAMADYLDEHGLFGIDNDEFAQIPFDIAEDMGIPYTIIDANGTDAFVDANASAGLADGDSSIGLTGSLGERDSKLIGTSESVDADGNTVHGEYYAASQTRTGAIGLGASWNDLTVGPTRDFTWANGNIIHVQYDADRNPMRVTAVTTTEWQLGEGQTAQVSFKLGGEQGSGGQEGGRVGPSRSARVGATHRVQDGDVTVTTTTIDIPAYQRADVADELQTFFDDDFGGVLKEGLPTLSRLARSPGATTTVQTYDSEAADGTSGIPINITVGIEWFDTGGSTRHQEMGLREASIVNPVTGAERPWVTCENAGGN
jgi:hypothetical protein